MRPRTSLLAVLLLAATALSSHGAHTRARLLLDHQSVRPGDSLIAAVLLKMDRGWHTYWQNSGGSGMPTTIEWHLPAWVKAGEIEWPVPEKLIDSDITTYIYHDEVMLMVPLSISKEAPAGTAQLKASVSWLECEVQCVPGSSEVESPLTVGTAKQPSTDAALFEAWRKRLPQPGQGLNPLAWWEAQAVGDTRPLLIQWTTSAGTDPDFFPDASEDFEVLGPTAKLVAPDGQVRIRKQVKKLSGAWPAKLSGIVVQGAPAQRIGYQVAFNVAVTPPGSTQPVPASVIGAPTPGPKQSLWLMLIYALIGGMILNIMPCVLPVIALKILGFVKQAQDDRKRVRTLGLIYTSGVLVSFLLLACLVIAVKAAGHKAGWGMQFGNPQFLVVLTVLITLVALNLFGLFEITPGGRVMGTAASLASKHGGAGAFFNGVLATVLATPCTAPFLGAALGFAFAQPAPIIALVFLTVGLGLALPYLVLSWEPGWLKFLPKPGAWMERFKIAMGFPMLATACWLFSLLPIHYGERSWWVALFLVVVALAAWVFGEFVQRGVSRRGLAIGIVGSLTAGGYLLIVEGALRWRSPDAGQQSTALVSSEPGGVPWEPWSRQAVSAARAEGRPVLVDFTAKWCLTCNTVVKPALESASVRGKLKQLNAVALIGDYTRFPPAITEELNNYGRAGVPLVLVYPPAPDKPAIVLPEAVTPGMVVAALEQAARKM